MAEHHAPGIHRPDAAGPTRPSDRGLIASFKDPLPHLKRAGEAALRVWVDPVSEVSAFAKSRSLVAYTAVLLAAILVLPLLLAATTGTFRFFGGALLWTLVATTALYAVTFAGTRILHGEGDWLEGLGLVSAVWLPLVPGLFVASLLGLASAALGAAVLTATAFVALHFLAVGLRGVSNLNERAAIYISTLSFVLFLGLLSRGITVAFMGAVPPGAF